MLERQKYFHQEKMAAIGTMAAGVAHEIGNPIAAIAGVAQEMSECRGACRAAQGLSEQWGGCRPDLILAQAQRLAGIAREISDVAAPQVSETQLLDLNEHLRGTVKLVRYDKRWRTVELRLDLDPQLPAIQAIPDQLTQLIMNLLINALDAMENVRNRPSVIIVSTWSDGERAWVTVVDNGHGMDKDVLSRAFDAFYTTKPAGKGTGLGLALCYSIMQNHGGSMDIDSVRGSGTRVQLSFPMEPVTAGVT
jgi:signal transduction histidine kinase